MKWTVASVGAFFLSFFKKKKILEKSCLSALDLQLFFFFILMNSFALAWR